MAMGMTMMNVHPGVPECTRHSVEINIHSNRPLGAKVPEVWRWRKRIPPSSAQLSNPHVYTQIQSKRAKLCPNLPTSSLYAFACSLSRTQRHPQNTYKKNTHPSTGTKGTRCCSRAAAGQGGSRRLSGKTILK